MAQWANRLVQVLAKHYKRQEFCIVPTITIMKEKQQNNLFEIKWNDDKH